MKIVPFEMWMADQLKPREEELEALQGADMVERLKMFKARGPVYAAMDDRGKKVLAVVGFAVYWKGVAEVWAFLTRDFLQHYSHRVHRMFHEKLKEIRREHGFRRVQASVPISRYKSMRWAQSFGFLVEAPVMAEFGPDGGDYALFALTGGF